MTGEPLSAEGSEDQVGQFARLGGMAGRDRDELGDEMGFIDVQAAAVVIGESPGADFGGAAVIDEAGAPRRFDAIARGRDAAAGFAGDDNFFDGQMLQD